MKKILGIFALAVSLIMSANVFAHSGMCGEKMQNMIDSLKLSDEQKEKIKPIMDNFKNSMQQSASQMKDLSKQIHDQVLSDKMDQSAVNGLIDQKTKLIGDMMKAKVMAKNQIYVLLTAEQKTELKNKMQEMEAKMAEKFKECHEED